MKPIAQYMTGRMLYQVFLHLSTIVLAVLVVVLVRQNRELRGGMAPPENFKVGDVFTLGGLVQVQGTTALDTASPCLLLIFNTRCPHCKKNIPRWQTLADSIGAEGIQIAGIALDSAETARRFNSENGIRFPVYVPDDQADFGKTRKVGSVPQTALRGGNGRIEYMWTGGLSEKALKEVVTAISEYKKPTKVVHTQ